MIMLKIIQVKDTDKLVAVAQYLTKYVKILKASEVFDDAFKTYIIKWQKDHNLTANGIINDDDWTVICKELPTCSTSKNKKSIYTCAIQILIGGLEVDGQYGPKTKKAVAAFQSACGLEADGICGPKTWAALICGKTVTPSADKILNECVNYLQWAKKWKNVKYSTHTSKQTIGNSGCGTTSMAMILATWEDSKITPVETSKWAVDNGYRTYDSGTSWSFFKWIFKKFDCFEKYIETSSIATLEAALREGALAVCSMNSNDNKFWTSSGCVNGPFLVNL
jgi:peptidoglycan hydrolase-like protein with peptidoglycan-binding domain